MHLLSSREGGAALKLPPRLPALRCTGWGEPSMEGDPQPPEELPLSPGAPLWEQPDPPGPGFEELCRDGPVSKALPAGHPLSSPPPLLTDSRRLAVLCSSCHLESTLERLGKPELPGLHSRALCSPQGLLVPWLPNPHP